MADVKKATTPNTGTIIDSSAITNINFAIVMVCCWFVPRLVSRRRLYHRTLRRSPGWVSLHAREAAQEAAAANSSDDGENNTDDDDPPELKAAINVVDRAMNFTIVGWLVFYVAVALLLSLLTRDLDYRTSYILIGLSYFVAAYLLFLLSYLGPQWLGVYMSIYSDSLDGRRIALGANLDALATKVRLLTFRTLMRFFPVMAPFFCGAQPGTIPISVLVGLNIGFYICLVIDWGNRTIHVKKNLRTFGLAIAGTFIVISSTVFAYGVGYVETVWNDKPDDSVSATEGISFAVWLIVASLLHVTVWFVSKNMKQSERYSETAVKRPHTFFGASVFISHRKLPSKRTLDNIYLEPANEEKEQAQPNKTSPEIEEVGMSPSAQVADNAKTEVTSDGVESAVRSVETEPQEEQSPKTEPVVIDITDEDELDTTCHLFNVVCCDLVCGEGGRTRSLPYRAYIIFRWIMWFLLLFASLFFVVILVGAQHQEKIVRQNLPLVRKVLYSNQNEGPMCAYDDSGNETLQEKVERTQRTFPSPEVAHELGYKILHCGACGKCSPWHNLRLQYATRSMLGQVSLECAKQTLIGGTYEDLVACTMEKTDFTEPCAKCWATDYQCTRNHCALIGIRAFMINSVTNLQVGADDITPASCEEAMCEATEITKTLGFVPCSGASRRRMNVTSTIKRPSEEQCRMVDIPRWDLFFGPSKGYGDYDPTWGENRTYGL